MQIGIDGNEANLKVRVGVGQYAFHLLWNLHDLDNENSYIIYLKDQPLSDMPPEKNNWHYRVFGPKKLWTKLALPFQLFTQKEKLELFFSPSHYSPQFSPFPTIPTIHDLGYLKYPEQFNQKDLYQLINWTKSSIKKAKHIVTVSQFSKNELKNIYQINGDKVTVAYNGVGEPIQVNTDQIKKTLDKFKIRNPYFLYLGTLKPNKNIPFLIKSFSQFINTSQKKDFQLVIAGKKGWLFEEIFTTVKTEKLEDKVIFTDFITEEEKWSLYKAAECVVLPSTYEGFGIPAIEAMKAGSPVIVSDIPPFREVVDDSGLFIDPNNQADLVVKLKEMTDPVTNSKFRKLGLIRADKFSWKNTAQSVINAFSSSRLTSR